MKGEKKKLLLPNNVKCSNNVILELKDIDYFSIYFPIPFYTRCCSGCCTGCLCKMGDCKVCNDRILKGNVNCVKTNTLLDKKGISDQD